MKKLYILILLAVIISCKKKENTVQPTPSAWTIYNSSNSPLTPQYAINTLFVDNSNVLWVGSDDLYSFNGSTWNDYNQSNTGVFIFWVTGGVKINNTNWFSSQDGLIKLQNNNWSLYTNLSSPGNAINCPIPTANSIAIDAQNNLWFAVSYDSNGVVKYDGLNNWITYGNSITTIPGNCTPSLIASATNGTIWVSTITLSTVQSAIIGCIAKYQNGSWTTFTSLNSNLPAASINLMALDKSNTLWLYSNSNYGELLKFDGTNFNIVNTSSAFPPQTAITGFTFDNHNNLWVASTNGAFEFNGSTWESFTTQNSSLPDNYVMAVAIDNNNTKWFGCNNGMVAKYTGN